MIWNSKKKYIWKSKAKIKTKTKTKSLCFNVVSAGRGLLYITLKLGWHPEAYHFHGSLVRVPEKARVSSFPFSLVEGQLYNQMPSYPSGYLNTEHHLPRHVWTHTFDIHSNVLEFWIYWTLPPIVLRHRAVHSRRNPSEEKKKISMHWRYWD